MANRIALLRLADKLEGTGPYKEAGPVPTERFDMGSWVVEDPKTIDVRMNDKIVEVVEKNLPCGTAACAAGWAGSDPWFQERGFYTTFNGVYHKDSNTQDFLACQHFFGLDCYDDANLIFSGDYSEDPIEKAQEIRTFIKNIEAREKEEAKEVNSVTGL
jgi:hypothetical protein